MIQECSQRRKSACCFLFGWSGPKACKLKYYIFYKPSRIWIQNVKNPFPNSVSNRRKNALVAWHLNQSDMAIWDSGRYVGRDGFQAFQGMACFRDGLCREDTLEAFLLESVVLIVHCLRMRSRSRSMLLHGRTPQTSDGNVTAFQIQ